MKLIKILLVVLFSITLTPVFWLVGWLVNMAWTSVQMGWHGFDWYVIEMNTEAEERKNAVKEKTDEAE